MAEGPNGIQVTQLSDEEVKGRMAFGNLILLAASISVWFGLFLSPFRLYLCGASLVYRLIWVLVGGETNNLSRTRMPLPHDTG